jgi:hypothetical protein
LLIGVKIALLFQQREGVRGARGTKNVPLGGYAASSEKPRNFLKYFGLNLEKRRTPSPPVNRKNHIEKFLRLLLKFLLLLPRFLLFPWEEGANLLPLQYGRTGNDQKLFTGRRSSPEILPLLPRRRRKQVQFLHLDALLERE